MEHARYMSVDISCVNAKETTLDYDVNIKASTLKTNLFKKLIILFHMHQLNMCIIFKMFIWKWLKATALELNRCMRVIV